MIPSSTQPSNPSLGVVLLAVFAALSMVLAPAVAAEPFFGPKASSSGPSGEVPAEHKGPLPDRYIVVLKESVEKPGRVAERHSENRGAQVRNVYRHALKGYAAKISKGELAAVKADPNVAYVERDGRGGIAAQSIPTGIDRVFATANAALAINEEDDVHVDADIAILDTGVADHPDLDLVAHVNCSGQPCAAGGSDGHGHGTHVAGTAAAIDNGYGVVGVAPGARIWGVKVLDSGGFGALSEFIAGIDWVTANAADIEVANSSLRYWGVEESKAFEEAIEASLEAGVVHVVAAGNDSEPVRYVPGNHADVITVSALEDYDGKPGHEEEGKDLLASFSNYGHLIDVAAPGADILSTVPWGSGYEGDWSGTSMASPHVAGAAAILTALEKPESREDVDGIRDAIVNEGNLDWFDTSDDEIQEPLLDTSNEGVFRVGPFQSKPMVTTKAATKVTGASASLNATINPNGLKTSYFFEYGTTPEYGSFAPFPYGEIGAVGKDSEVTVPIGVLAPKTKYHFRIVAINSEGITYGEDMEFTTAPAPAVSTGGATEVKGTSAVLSATVNPNGFNTSYLFEYGTSPSYGQYAPASPKAVGDGTEALGVSEELGELVGDTKYYYRVIATNSKGTSVGEGKSFTTSPTVLQVRDPNTEEPCPDSVAVEGSEAFGGCELQLSGSGQFVPGIIYGENYIEGLGLSLGAVTINVGPAGEFFIEDFEVGGYPYIYAQNLPWAGQLELSKGEVSAVTEVELHAGYPTPFTFQLDEIEPDTWRWSSGGPQAVKVDGGAKYTGSFVLSDAEISFVEVEE